MKQPSLKMMAVMNCVTGLIFLGLGIAGMVRHSSFGVLRTLLGVFWLGMAIYRVRTAGQAEISLSLRGGEQGR